MTIMRSLALLTVSALGACNHDPRLALDYQLASTLSPTTVSRIETRVAVAPGDPRAFTADLPFRAVDVGVGYEVRDFDGNGQRTLLITHDATLGYSFSADFVFTLLPPVGDAPPLTIRARALGVSANDILAQTDALAAAFHGDTTLRLPLADMRCAAGVTCSGNTTCCGGGCFDLLTNAKHCGECGKSCGKTGGSCSGGACRCNGGSACTGTQSCCPGLGCIDITDDPFNCGACGKACALGETCSAGVCSCGGRDCAASQVCCAGTCTSGGCACGGSTCDASLPLCCEAGCTSTATDDRNCGACGDACSGGDSCAGGHCRCNGVSVCSTGDTCCASGCSRLDDDPNNCGACGKRCGTGETCSASVCHCGTQDPDCSATQLCCANSQGDRSCVVVTKDENNCGGCGVVCAATEQCLDGACVCPGTSQRCGSLQTCCPGVGCFDLSRSAAHCGSCTVVCPPGEMCTTGSCEVQSGGCGQGCPSGSLCVAGVCTCNGVAVMCSFDKAQCCPNPQATSTGCIDTNSDVNNCGGCGRVCANDQPLCCNGACIASTKEHCGSCTKVCTNEQTCNICSATANVPATAVCVGINQPLPVCPG